MLCNYEPMGTEPASFGFVGTEAVGDGDVDVGSKSVSVEPVGNVPEILGTIDAEQENFGMVETEAVGIGTEPVGAGPVGNVPDNTGIEEMLV